MGFLSALEDGGRLTVPSLPALQDPAALDADKADDADALDARLEALAARVRADLAHAPPALSLPVARWAACAAWNACQALVHRALPTDALARALETPCPAAPSPATALSADLVLSILPDLLALARGPAPDDPARALLVRLARAWPLSSVGADLGPGPFDVDAFVGDASLRALYVDRILARVDLSRLGDPRVDDAAREALGARPELCPVVAHALGVQVGVDEVAA